MFVSKPHQSLESLPTNKVEVVQRGKKMLTDGKKEKILKLSHFCANFINPAVYITFCLIYFQIY